MEPRTLGSTGLQVTPVGFGALTIGRNQLDLPLREGAAVIRHALERGIRLFDTAEYYGTYPYLREALRGSKQEPVIVTKSYQTDAGGMAQALENARHSLDRDVIDIFLLHEVRSPVDFSARAAAWDTLQTARSKGLVRAVGLSTHHVDVARMAAGIPEADVLFALINLAGFGICDGNGAGTRTDMEAAIASAGHAGKGVLAMKVFGGGLLLDRYREAFSYVAGLPGVTAPMIGFGSAEEVDRIVDLLEGRLDPGYVPNLSEKRYHVDPGDCTGCLLCRDRCPNEAIGTDENGLAFIGQDRCLRCGYCLPACPVHAIHRIG